MFVHSYFHLQYFIFIQMDIVICSGSKNLSKFVFSNRNVQGWSCLPQVVKAQNTSIFKYLKDIFYGDILWHLIL